MSSIYSFEVRVFECIVQIEAECLEAYTVLERYTFPSFPRIANVIEKPDISIRVVRIEDQLQLLVDDVMVASDRLAISLVPDLIRVLDNAVIQRLTTLRAVHAGAVQWGDRVLLLPGSTHAGKSSLVAELLRRGATYFSDEYALIDSEGLLHPYPRPLLVRNGRPEQVPMLPCECNASTGAVPVAVGCILTLHYLPGSTWSAEAVTQSETVLTLLRNTPHILGDTPDMVRVFKCAVAGAVCFSGHRSEAVDAVDHILRLVYDHE